LFQTIPASVPEQASERQLEARQERHRTLHLRGDKRGVTSISGSIMAKSVPEIVEDLRHDSPPRRGTSKTPPAIRFESSTN
jgi:hypothetical protein